MRPINLTNFRFDMLTFVAKRFSFLKRIPLITLLVDEQMKCLTFFLKPNVSFVMSSICREVKSWDGVSTSYHKFGGLQFNTGRREIAHLHGNGLLDVRVPKKLRNIVNKLEFVENHHMLNHSNWISVKITDQSDNEAIVALLHLVYKSCIKH